MVGQHCLKCGNHTPVRLTECATVADAPKRENSPETEANIGICEDRN